MGLRNALLITAFFVSGAAALVYEVSWIRRATLIFGSTQAAVSSVLALFFLGLALGSQLFGRLSPRLQRPLRAVVAMELGVAALALASPWAFDGIEAVHVGLRRAWEPGPLQAAAVRIALAATVLLPPTLLLGGTLPLFCRHYVAAPERVATPVGRLYAWNTLGAAAGCAAAGLVLIPALGLRATLACGAALSAAAALVIALAARGARPAAIPAAGPPAPATRAGLVGLLFLGVGFVALGNEVLWTRYLALLVRSTVATYTLALCVVLLGIALGSALLAPRFDSTRALAWWFGALQAGSAILVLGIALTPPEGWALLGDSLASYAALLLLPAVLSGASFPLAVRMVVVDPARAGAGVGRLSALNTLGGIAGSLAIGLLVLPAFGLQTSLLLLTGLGVATAMAAWLGLERGVPRTQRFAAAGLTAGLWLALPSLFGTRLPDAFLAHGEEVVAVKEGLASTLAVVRDRRGLHLKIDRWWQGRDRPTHQRLAAHVPMLLHSTPRRVLVIGAGTGQTPAAFLLHPIERLDCVEIEPAVFGLIRAHFDGAWLDDGRVQLIAGDGRNAVAHSRERYDVISLEVGQTFRPGVAFFYTLDFYERARRRLAADGLLVQFVPLPFLTTEQLRGVVRTFLEAFPESVLWYNTAELLLIGQNAASLALGGDGPTRLLSDSPVRADLDYRHWGGPENRVGDPRVFLAGFLSGPEGLAALARGGGVYRDDRPVLDHATRSVDEAATLELTSVALIRRHLEPVERWLPTSLSEEALREVRAIREGNLRDVSAAALARRAILLRDSAPRDEITALLNEAVSLQPGNADAQRLLGDALLLAEDESAARSHYAAALRSREDDFPARRGMGIALLRAGRAGEAAHHLRIASTLEPDDPETLNDLGVAVASQGYYAVAMRHFEQALRLRPGWAEAEENLVKARSLANEAGDPAKPTPGF